MRGRTLRLHRDCRAARLALEVAGADQGSGGSTRRVQWTCVSNWRQYVSAVSRNLTSSSKVRSSWSGRSAIQPIEPKKATSPSRSTVCGFAKCNSSRGSNADSAKARGQSRACGNRLGLRSSGISSVICRCRRSRSERAERKFVHRWGIGCSGGAPGGTMRVLPLPECLGTVVIHRGDAVTCTRDTCRRDLSLESWFGQHASFITCNSDVCPNCRFNDPVQVPRRDRDSASSAVRRRRGRLLEPVFRRHLQALQDPGRHASRRRAARRAQGDFGTRSHLYLRMRYVFETRTTVTQH